MALGDDEDYRPVSEAGPWSALIDRKGGNVNNVYARCNLPKRNGRRATQLMHRLVIGVTNPAIQVDHHPDFNGLNNQRSNLRIATQTDNARNHRIRRDNSSGFKGVCWSKRSGKWKAQISINGKRVGLGYFVDKHAAVL